MSWTFKEKLMAAAVPLVVLAGLWVGPAPASSVGEVRSGAVAASAAEVRSLESARVDAWVEERMAAHGIPGAAVAVVRGGEVVHLAGYGTADPSGRPVTPDTSFVIGSASKPFTALVARQLVGEGHLSWDEPVWPYLSAIVEEAPDGFEEVTVGQLLRHTAGLGMLVGVAGAVEVHHGPDALERRVVEILSHPLARAPGEHFEYSNAGPTLLAAVIEQITGQSFADVLRDRVFDPLGMSGSFASEHDPRAADLATGHQLWFGRWRPADLPYDLAGVAMGYIGSTGRDLAAFLQAHLDGDRRQVIPATATEIANGTVVPTGWDTPLEAGYGTGWFVDEIHGKRVVSHSGSLGHFTAHLILVPEADDLGIAVLTNASAFIAAGHAAQYDLSLGLADLLLGEEPSPRDRGVLLTFAAPVAAWVIAALLVLGFVRDLLVTLPRRRHLLARRSAGIRRWIRLLLPGAALLAVAGGLLSLPLGVFRHFYPDVGTALTLIAYVALAWGVVRIGLAAGSLLGPGRRVPEAVSS